MVKSNYEKSRFDVQVEYAGKLLQTVVWLVFFVVVKIYRYSNRFVSYFLATNLFVSSWTHCKSTRIFGSAYLQSNCMLVYYV